MDQNRIGGIAYCQVNGELIPIEGAWSYNLGRNKREAMLGSSGMAGYKETPQVPFLEGKALHKRSFNLEAILAMTGGTISFLLPNGDEFVLREAWTASEGTGSTEDGGVDLRFEGMRAELIRKAS